MKRTLLVPAGLLLGSAVLGGWLLQDGVARDRNLYEQVRVFQEVVDRISREYVEDMPGTMLYETAVDGILESLDDPYSYIFEPDGFEQFRIQTEGRYAGVGLEIVVRSGRITVMSPIAGGPAAAKDIRAGDQIVSVEGESTEGWDVDRMGEMLRGSPGTEVAIELRRPGSSQAIPVTLERADIRLPAVPFVMLLDEQVGYVPVQLFRETVTTEVRTAVDSLRSLGAAAVILDLRGNPGGLLEEGIGMTDLFLPVGAAIVETRRRDADDVDTYTAESSDRYPDLALIVLVDEGSASASEIVAGALQDHDRAVLVGTRTYGKGSVQTLYPLSGGQVLKLTTARWFTPSGRSIQAGEEDPATDHEGDAFSLEGRIIKRSSVEGRPTFTSFGGEVLYGGGGITPNEIVLPDTMSTVEIRAFRDVVAATPDFPYQLFDFAVSYLQKNPEIQSMSELDTDLVSRFQDRLRGFGRQVSDRAVAEAMRPLLFQIGREISVQKWGAQGEFSWLAQYDLQLQRALELARGTTAGKEPLTPEA